MQVDITVAFYGKDSKFGISDEMCCAVIADVAVDEESVNALLRSERVHGAHFLLDGGWILWTKVTDCPALIHGEIVDLELWCCFFDRCVVVCLPFFLLMSGLRPIEWSENLQADLGVHLLRSSPLWKIASLSKRT